MTWPNRRHVLLQVCDWGIEEHSTNDDRSIECWCWCWFCGWCWIDRGTCGGECAKGWEREREQLWRL